MMVINFAYSDGSQATHKGFMYIYWVGQKILIIKYHISN